MAYKEESHQQFMESLSRQLSGFKSRTQPVGKNSEFSYHGFEPEDKEDDNAHYFSNNNAAYFRRLSGKKPSYHEDPLEDDDQNDSDLLAQYKNVQQAPVEPRDQNHAVLKNLRYRGGYSSDAGRFPNQKPVASYDIGQHRKVFKIKSLINKKEREIETLKQNLQKITGIK